LLSNTSGHRDIVNSRQCIASERLRDYNVKDSETAIDRPMAGTSLDEMVEQLEYAYHHRSVIRTFGKEGAEHMKLFTWRHAALNLVKLMGI
jgi:hypothetical protein